MKITLVHLSDFHFRCDKHNHCLDFVDEISAAITSRLCGTIVIIVVTGDIAFSGIDSEYNISLNFFEDLQKKINERISVLPLLVMVPGNHDCDFSIAGENREIIINNITDTVIKEETYIFCNNVQTEYETFESVTCPSPDSLINGVGYKISIFDFEGKKIAFRQQNTAWMSSRDEKYGIRLPVNELPQQHSQELINSDLTIGLMHHTFNWLEQSCSRKLRTDLQATCDLVLTGHEHEAGGYLRVDLDNNETEYIEGGVLQSHYSPTTSNFNLICIDTDEENMQIHQFQLRDEIYIPKNSFVKVFTRNTRRLRQVFSFSELMKDKLDDLEVGFKHPYKENLCLGDLFVYPECQQISVPGSKSSYKPIIEASSQLFEKSPFIYLAGPEKSGKTTLAKKIIIDLHSQGIISVLTKGKDFKKIDSIGIRGLVSDLVSEQYSNDAVEPYLQLKKEERLIIIDDYHLAKIKGRSKDSLLITLTEFFGKVLLLGNNDSRWNELYQASQNKEETYTPFILSFDHYELVELGPVKRSDLVQKWLSAGITSYVDPDEIHRKSINAEDIISKTIGNNLIPAYPLFVLMLIQQLESKNTAATAHGAQGYLYESLITLSLIKTSKYEAELDIKYKYLSDLAFSLYDSTDHEISKDDLSIWHINHCRDNLIKLDFEKLVRELITARILVERDDCLLFVYPYIRYYFTARHIRDNIENNNYKNLIIKLTKDLHRQESSDILMFISYLSKDKFVLDTLLESATNIFSNIEPFDYKNPPEFLIRAEFKRAKLVLKSINPSRARREELKRIESLNRDKNNISAQNSDNLSVNEQVDNVNNVTSAIKTIQILGQILRSYPGSLSAPEKIRIAEECYKLGLRVTSFCINFFDKHGTEISEQLVKITTNLHPDCSRDVLEKEAKAFIFSLCSKISFGMLKQISGSVGLEELSPVFSKITEECDSLSYKLIDLSIKLDHHKNFPKKDSINLYENTNTISFTSDIIRSLVWYHLHMFTVPFTVRQSVCDKLGIELSQYEIVSSGRLIEHKK